VLPKARKRFGQHFLTDRHYLARIVATIDPRPDDAMVEIGPGTGILTAPLAEKIHPLHVVEIDRDLAAQLRHRFPPDQVIVHEGDALEYDFTTLPANLRVVGNLPYNVSTPILFRIAAIADRVRDCVFLLQKEVVERMVAEPASPEYGRLSVMLQYRFSMALAIEVPPGAFTPPPKVDAPARARRGALLTDRRLGLRAAPQDASQRRACRRAGNRLRRGGRRSPAARRNAGGRGVRAPGGCDFYERWMNSIL
jgi:16S rRNA (adenine1518-N6/adenine1519-N6)-dimethyltransferase